MINKKALKEKELELVDGGYLFADGQKHMWQVINDKNGDVEYETFLLGFAENEAKRRGFSTKVIQWDEVDRLRKNARKQS